MLLINSSPRQFLTRLALLWVLFFLSGCGRRDASLYPPKSASSNVPARTSPSANTSTYRVDGEPTWLVNGVLRADAGRPQMLSNASLVMPAPTPTSISISPARASLAPNQTLQFTTAVTGTTHHAVKWLVEGHEGGDASVGTVSAAGVYTAPSGPAPWPSVTITAVSVYESKAFASAVVMIMPALRDEQHQ